MISHTKAYASYKELSQAHLDFVVLICHAVPALRADLVAPGVPLSQSPDYFKPKQNTKTQLKTYAAAYQVELGRTTLITIFSFFESYVKGAMREIASFHGGNPAFKALALDRASKFITRPSAAVEKNKRKLQEHVRKGKDLKYRKFSRLLDKNGFRFPTELLAYFGVIQLLEKAKDDRKGMRAWEVPDILQDCLLFPLTTADRAQFDSLRKLRNDIAHGKAPLVTLQRSLRAASSLHTLAAKIDRHLVDHFFVLQKFV